MNQSDKYTHLHDIVLENTKGKSGDFILHHYTSSAGFLGIAEKGLFYASHFRWFNDPSELTHGIDLINNGLIQLVSNESNPTVKEKLKPFIGSFETIKRLFEFDELIFTLSFSEHGDMLSQWREYGDGGKGYSLGIIKRNILDTSGIDIESNMECINSWNKFLLFKIIYDLDTQKEIAIKFYEVIKEQVISGLDFKGIYYRLIILLALAMKHPSYQGENEWRLAYWQNPLSTSNSICFRERNGRLVPYLRFGFNEGTGISLINKPEKPNAPIPVECIHIGPAIKSMNESIFQKLITKHGTTIKCKKNGTKHSECPYHKTV